MTNYTCHLASLQLRVVVLTLQELDDGWKLFYSRDEPAKFVSPQLVKCVDEWVPLKKDVQSVHVEQGCGVRSPVIRLQLLAISIIRLQLQTDSDL